MFETPGKPQGPPSPRMWSERPGTKCERGRTSGPRFHGWRVALDKLDGRDRPPAIMATNRNSQSVEFVEPDIIDCTGLPIGEDHGLSDQVGLRLLQSGEDRGRAVLESGQGNLRERCSERHLQLKGGQVVTCARRTDVGSNSFVTQSDSELRRLSKSAGAVQIAVRRRLDIGTERRLVPAAIPIGAARRMRDWFSATGEYVWIAWWAKDIRAIFRGNRVSLRFLKQFGRHFVLGSRLCRGSL
jgi:hypothetical protein